MTFWEYLTNRRMLLLAERLAQCGVSAEDIAAYVPLILESVESAGAAATPTPSAKRAGWR